MAAPEPIAIPVHVLAGVIGLVSGVVAAFSRKGDRLHRLAGTIFVASMLIVAVLADYLAVVRPGQIVNLFIGSMTFYLVLSGWLTMRRPKDSIGRTEGVLFAFIVCLGLPFLVLSVQLAAGFAPFFRSAVPLRGPVMIAIYVFTSVVLIAAFGDARMLATRGVSGRRRLERHLWRMGFGLALASGSAFTNGLPRLLPRTVSIPLPFLFVPQLAALALMVFWLGRVRFGQWPLSLIHPQRAR